LTHRAARTAARLGGLAAVLLAGLVPAAPASAELRAVADGSAPVLFGDRVLWMEGGGIVMSAPLGGGAAVRFGSVSVDAHESATLAAGSSGVAVEVRDGEDGRLFLAGADGAFRQIADDVGDPPITPWIPGLGVTDAGILTLEDGLGAYLRDGAHRSEVALPPGADRELVAAGGGRGVASTPDGGLVVFDLRTGTELRQISLGRFDPATINGLAISPGGDVAASVPTGDGGDVPLWAPRTGSRVRVLSTGREYSSVATAGGRVAFIGADGLRDGVRVSVIDSATRKLVFRGPPAFDIGALGYDGTNVAFSTPSCALVGTGSRRTLPPGPCVRTDVGVTPEAGNDRYRVRVACINAPAGTCRVRARLTRRGAGAGSVDARIPRGSARVLEIPVRTRGHVRLTVRVTDPDGRTRTAYDA
jgi:hypothetical protein